MNVEGQPQTWQPGARQAPAGQGFGVEAPPDAWADSAQANDRTMPAPLRPSEVGAAAAVAPATERKPLARRDIALSAGLYLLCVVAAFGWAYDLFAKLFDLVHNRCTAKRDFSVQCIVIRPPASALWGLLIGGGGMFLALVGAMVLASVAAMTGRRAWIWTAIALPLILAAGGAGHVLVATAIS